MYAKTSCLYFGEIYSTKGTWFWDFDEENDLSFGINYSDEVRLLFLLSQLYSLPRRMK